MKTFRASIPIEGDVIIQIEAESPEEAYEKFKNEEYRVVDPSWSFSNVRDEEEFKDCLYTKDGN